MIRAVHFAKMATASRRLNPQELVNLVVLLNRFRRNYHVFIDFRFLCLHSRKNPIQTEWTLANFVLQHLQ